MNLTEDQIEYRVEKWTDALDHNYMNNVITTEQYEAEIKRINAWANEQFDKL